MAIPFVPFPLKKALRAARIFSGAGNIIARSSPSLKVHLYQAELHIEPRHYVSLAIFTAVFYLVMLFGLTFFVGVVAGRPDALFSLFIGTVMFAFVYLYIMKYPSLVSLKRVKRLERDLLNALHHMYVELKAGVPLFNTLAGISEGYGEVSAEFRKVVNDINGGVSESAALNEVSKRNPSLHFRRAVWQIVNALRSGSDIAKALETIIETLTKEQTIAIRKYAQELNPFTMMYMLFSVIMPTLGITFLIILSSFSGAAVGDSIFIAIIVVLVIFQFFYIGLVKTKRPAVDV